MTTNNNFIKIIDSWIGTKFHYAGRIKKNNLNNGGIDCIGFVMKVGEEINSCYSNRNIIHCDYINYSRYPNHGEMMTFLDKYFIKIKKEDIKTGDLIYFNFKNKLEHIGIYLSNNEIAHCSASSKMVVKEKLSEFWIKKIIGFYRYGNFTPHSQSHVPTTTNV
jgi:lipoprotein Spr